MYQAGYELDRMIASMVFNRFPEYEEHPTLGPVEVIANYSKNDGRALEVLKELQRRLYMLEVGCVDRIWYCTMYTSPNTRFIGRASTMALAICNVALEAVKDLDKYKNN